MFVPCFENQNTCFFIHSPLSSCVVLLYHTCEVTYGIHEAGRAASRVSGRLKEMACALESSRI